MPSFPSPAEGTRVLRNRLRDEADTRVMGTVPRSRAVENGTVAMKASFSTKDVPEPAFAADELGLDILCASCGIPARNHRDVFVAAGIRRLCCPCPRFVPPPSEPKPEDDQEASSWSLPRLPYHDTAFADNSKWTLLELEAARIRNLLDSLDSELSSERNNGKGRIAEAVECVALIRRSAGWVPEGALDAAKVDAS